MTTEPPIEPIVDDDLNRRPAGSLTRTRAATEFFREGNFAAEVNVELHYFDECWSPCLTADDARKLETVMLALRRGDLAVGSSRVDLQACKLEYSIVSPK